MELSGIISILQLNEFPTYKLVLHSRDKFVMDSIESLLILQGIPKTYKYNLNYYWYFNISLKLQVH